MERWTRFMIRHRFAVVGIWIVALLASVYVIQGLSDLLTNRFTLPGTDTRRAEVILEEQFGQKSTGSFTIVAEGGPGTALLLMPQLREAAARAAAVLPTGRTAAVLPVSD